MSKTNSIIHVCGTYEKENFKRLLDTKLYKLEEAYGLFWILIEKIYQSENHRLNFSSLDQPLKQFAECAIANNLIQFETNTLSVYSTFLDLIEKSRIAKGQLRKQLEEARQKEISTLKEEIARLNKIFKLRRRKNNGQ
jgi:hypothetical protein